MFEKNLARENDDLIKMGYHNMLKYQAEKNWANNAHELRGRYNLPLDDENVSYLTYTMWKKMVYDQVKYVAFFYHLINSLKHHTVSYKS